MIQTCGEYEGKGVKCPSLMKRVEGIEADLACGDWSE